jgi:SAM-dependent methyltransferase
MLIPRQDDGTVKLEAHSLQAARDYNVSAAIHGEDHIFRAICWIFDGDIAKGFDHYMMNGRIGAEKIRDFTARHFKLATPDGQILEPLRILDFAAGYGAVARHFANLFPNATVSPMDIHGEAVNFNRDVLGLPALLSKTNPDDIAVDQKFDVLFVISFFSHLPRKTFARWLETLAGLVRPGGLFIFTTHGKTTHRELMAGVAVSDEGYGFIADSEQFDLSTEEYGHAVTYRPFVERGIAAIPGLNLLDCREGVWGCHQDIFIVGKSGETPNKPTAAKAEPAPDHLDIWTPQAASAHSMGPFAAPMSFADVV